MSTIYRDRRESNHTPSETPSPLFDGEIRIVRGTVSFGGSTRPTNPGPSYSAFILRVDGHQVIRKSIGIGFATNNVAEYRALLFALQAALDAGVTHLVCSGDSLLVISGVQNYLRRGNNKKGMAHLEALKREAGALARKFVAVQFSWCGANSTLKQTDWLEDAMNAEENSKSRAASIFSTMRLRGWRPGVAA